MPRLNVDEKGFTLIEVLVAIAVLSLGLIVFNIMQVQSVKGNADGIGLSSMSWIATDFVENIIEEDFNTVENLDGTGTNDGVAGLNDGIPTNAGSPVSATTPDAIDTSFAGFEIRYNVAKDTPEDDIITIRIIVVRMSDGKKVVYDYFKSELG